jgi:hypothetical protein
MIPNRLLREIYYSYNNNPFHNIKHAYEVFETMSHLLNIVNVKKQFTLVDKTILLLTALCHDINHQGKTNRMLKQESFESMIEFCNNIDDDDKEICMKRLTIERDRSYDNLFNVETFEAFNEKTHQEITMKLIKKYNIFYKKVSDEYVLNFVQSLILSTDLNLHDTYHAKFDINNKFSLGTILMKIADLSHPTRDFKVHLYWVFKLKEEHGLHITTVEEIAEDTLGFISKFVFPLLLKLNEHHNLHNYIKKIEKNISIWQEYIT